jgi:hypothetical protein
MTSQRRKERADAAYVYVSSIAVRNKVGFNPLKSQKVALVDVFQAGISYGRKELIKDLIRWLEENATGLEQDK